MRRWIVTFFGTGLSPVAPGTAGSLLASLILAGLYLALGIDRANLILIVGLIVSSVLTVTLGPWAVVHFGRKDPGPVVLDEVAGICLTNLFIPLKNPWIVLLAAFLAFRAFDVTKPSPARNLEKLPGGWGILLDDLMAAVYANLLCQILFRWWPIL